jgi:hypothetical protein
VHVAGLVSNVPVAGASAELGVGSPSLPAFDEPELDREPLPEAAAAEPAGRRGRVVAMRLPPKRISGIAALLPPLSAAALLVALLSTPSLTPRHLLLPFPWQDTQRQAVEANQRSARYLQLDRAARTFFLLEGHYPDKLEELLGLGLIGPDAQRDPAGDPFDYSSDALSYRLEPVRDGRPDPERGVREAVTGDFLLDPDFLRLPDRPERQPLVLID